MRTYTDALQTVLFPQLTQTADENFASLLKLAGGQVVNLLEAEIPVRASSVSGWREMRLASPLNWLKAFAINNGQDGEIAYVALHVLPRRAIDFHDLIKEMESVDGLAPVFDGNESVEFKLNQLSHDYVSFDHSYHFGQKLDGFEINVQSKLRHFQNALAFWTVTSNFKSGTARFEIDDNLFEDEIVGLL